MNNTELFIRPTGACVYCGQVAAVTMSDDDLSEGKSPDDLATERCQCPEASRFRHIREERQRAENRIQSLFVTCEEEADIKPLTEERTEIIRLIVAAMIENKLQAAALDLFDGVRCRVSRNAKDELEISRTDTATRKMKV